MQSDADYRAFSLAYIPQIRYLDYALIDEEERKWSCSQFQDELETLKENEDLQKARQATLKEQEERAAQIKDARMSPIESLLRDMAKDGGDSDKYTSLPGCPSILSEFEHRLQEEIDSAINAVLKIQSERKEEEAQFQIAVNALLRGADEQSIELIQAFKKRLKDFFHSLNTGTTLPFNDDETPLGSTELEEGAHNLSDSLCLIEEELFRKVKDILDIFETRFDVFHGNAATRTKDFVHSAEEMEAACFEGLMEVVNGLEEKFAQNVPIGDLENDHGEPPID